MTETPDDDTRSPAERVTDLPGITAALGKAVAAALQRHKQMGNPIAVWRNERVEWIPPEEIPTLEEMLREPPE